ncbi:hypothetical protein GCM10027578_33740 [Spirosoma luteolum]
MLNLSDFIIIFGINLLVPVKRIVPICLSALLLYHTLAYVLVCIGAWWQAEHDLSQRLSMYRSVDSLVEFQIPLADKANVSVLTQSGSDGFTYHGHYYSVVSLEIQGDVLQIAALESESRSFWQSDLLSFLNDRITGSGNTSQKANQFLKFLLKEYSPNRQAVFQFLTALRPEAIRIPDAVFVFVARALPVFSPPPEC